jgi:peptidoglycan hydrolase-like protein with peptidoglycan-binding domain
MSKIFKKGDQGKEVKVIQTRLMEKGFITNEEINGIFNHETYLAVRAFQAQNLDRHGDPLTVDGKVGELTWWSLHNPKPDLQLNNIDVYKEMPSLELGGTKAGRAALQAAIDELKQDAREIGGDNRGPFVQRYLNGILPEGNPWCAGFVSYCFTKAPSGIPFNYTLGARNVLQQFKKRGWAHEPNSGYSPQPGDVVVWWREQIGGEKGHVGIVHHLGDGFLYTIEGNKSPRVQGFKYIFSRMDKLLGFGKVPD